ncbi:hypothetical protein M0R45_013488 [Rubus argutus]|uniref:Uncharacterized protein n=1 Tax=Rubus argutus TaxID=59490 RepID=A0AAW1XKP6_RUBAR
MSHHRLPRRERPLLVDRRYETAPRRFDVVHSRLEPHGAPQREHQCHSRAELRQLVVVSIAGFSSNTLWETLDEAIGAIWGMERLRAWPQGT